MQNPDTDTSSLSRLKKYDTADNLNIVAFSTPSGNEILNIYPHDIKYIKNNRMYDKDPTIIATAETNSEYMYKNSSNSFEIYYPKHQNETPLLFSNETGKILLKPSTTLENDIFRTDNTITYQSLQNPQNKYSFTSNYDGLDISISAPTTQQTYLFELNVEGYTPVRNENTIQFINSSTNTPEFILTSPIVTDSDGELRNINTHIDLAAPDNNQTYILSISVESPSENEINNSNNVYTISTSLSQIADSNISDAIVFSNFANQNASTYSLAVIGSASVYGIGRYYVKYDLSSLSNIKYDRVISAYYEIYHTQGNSGEIEAYMVTGDWDASTITWNNKPNYNSELISRTTMNPDDGSISGFVDPSIGKSHFYITPAVQAWLQGINNYGLLLKDSRETDKVNYFRRSGENANQPTSLHIVLAPDDGVTSRGVSNETYYIKSKINNMFMTAGGDYDGAAVTQENLKTARESQLWKLEKQSDGYYKITPACSTTRCLKATTNITISTNTNASDQRWQLRRNWDGSYSILSKSSNFKKDVSVGVSVSVAGRSLVYENDRMTLRKYDDWTLIPNSKGISNAFGTNINIATQGDALNVKNKLESNQNLCYTTNANLDKEASYFLSKMPESRLLFYFGHGNTGLLAFPNSILTGSQISYASSRTVDSLSANALSAHQFTLYHACLAGRTMDSSSIVGMTYYRGSHYVTAFFENTFTNMGDLISTSTNENGIQEDLLDKLASGMTIYEAFNEIDTELYDYHSHGQPGNVDLSAYVEPFRYRNFMGDNSLVYNISEYSLD